MCRGLRNCQSEVILFWMLTFAGLKRRTETTFRAGSFGDYDMTIGIFANGRLTTDLAQKVAPFLSDKGQ